MRRLGVGLAAVWLVAAAAAPWLAPYDPQARHGGREYASPTRVRVAAVPPYFHPVRPVSPLERRFEEDRSRRVNVAMFTGGRLFASADPGEPLLLLGADGQGRDVFSRLVTGARTSLALALVSAALATCIGLAVGLAGGYAGGRLDSALTRVSELVLVLPALYVVVALRAALPLVLSPGAVFLLLSLIFALVAWPVAARGVRAIVASERTQPYVEAARAAGARRRRVLSRHLLPAARGYLGTQFALLVPGCLLFEGALSFAGLGFPEHVPTWGTMLQEAANVGALGTAPWLLTPAVAIVSVVLAINLIVESSRDRLPQGLAVDAAASVLPPASRLLSPGAGSRVPAHAADLPAAAAGPLRGTRPTY
jgi:peptide/nickel transport system permease protein